jgi:hypothetical protein
MADTHGPQEPQEPQHDTSDHGRHDAAMSDEPIARPDGTMPPRGQRPLGLGIGIAGALILLLVVAGVILYMNRNGNTAEAPGASSAGGAAPEAILVAPSLHQTGEAVALAKANVVVGQLRPGTYRQQSGVVTSLTAKADRSKALTINAAASATRTPTRGAGSSTPAPTKAAAQSTYQDTDGRFTVRFPGDWTADDSQKDDFFVVEITGTDPQGGPLVDVYSEDVSDTNPALDDLIALDQKAHAGSQKFSYKDGATTDTTVGGEPARTYTYTFVSKANPKAAPWAGQTWDVIHNGQRFLIDARAIGSHKSEVASIISSFSFSGGGNNNGNGENTTFTDPDGLITLTYPSSWTAGKADGDDANVLVIDSPTGASLGLDISDQTGTPDQELQTVRGNRSGNASFSFKFGNLVDLKIGGEPAKMMPWVWTSKQDAKKTGAGRDYIVNHGGKWFGFTALAPDTNAFSDLEGVINTTTFGGATNNNGGGNTTGTTTTWQDPNGTVQLQVPNGWTAGVDTSSDGNVVTLQSPDGEVFYIDALDPFDSLDTIIGNIKANHQASTKYVYKDGEVKDLKVGGEPAKSIAYTYTPKGQTGAKTYQAKIWILNHGGQGYFMSGSPLDQAGPTVEAIVSSLKFLK